MISRISRPLALALLAVGSPCLAQAMVQPIGVSDADALAEQVRRLGGNPLDLDALLTAGELSLRLDDLSAAGAFFSRAEKIDPRNARAKAGEGALVLRNERPGEALRLFAQAEQMGLPSTRFAADRALAYDLIGDQPRAAREYRAAMEVRPDAETRRRYALSLAIAGKQALALDELAPLIRQNDRAAWRSRAFILAMGGDTAGAAKIAQTMMPPGSASGLQGFFAELPRLPAIDRAFAVHFGEVHPTAARFADARLAPALAPLPAEPAAVQVAALIPDNGKKRKKDKRDKRDRIAVAALIPTSAPVEPAYQPPAYQPRVVASTPRYPSYPAPSYPRPSYPSPSYSGARAANGGSDRPLTAGELASLGAAGMRATPNRAVRAAPPATPGFSSVVAPRQLTPAEQASLAAATVRPTPLRLADRVQIAAALPTPAPVVRLPSPASTTTATAVVARVPLPTPASAPAASLTAPVVTNALPVPTPTPALAAPIAAPSPAPAVPAPALAAAVAAPGVATAVPVPTSAATLAALAAVPSVSPASAVTEAASPVKTAAAPTAPTPVSRPVTLAALAPATNLVPQPSATGSAAATAPTVVGSTLSSVTAAPAPLATPALTVVAIPLPGAEAPAALTPIPATPAPSVLAEATAPTVAAAAEVALATPKPAVSTPLAPLLIAPPIARGVTARAPRSRGRNIEADSILAKIVANLSIPASELGVDGPVRAEPGAKPPTAAERRAARRKGADSLGDQTDAKSADTRKSDKKALAAKKDAADKKALATKQAGEAKKTARADPERIWVQVSGGANESDLTKAWGAVRKKAPGALGGKQGYTTPLRATNRVLTGPFKSDAEARAYVNQLAKTGVSAFTFTSDAGQKVTRLPTK